MAVVPLRVPVPRVVVPSRKVTDPVGAMEPLPVTVAVKVTEAPTAAGFELEASAVVSGDGAAVMVCVNTVEVLAALLLSPPYAAVIECAPAARLDVENLAIDPLRVPVPRVVVPSRKVADPVGAMEPLPVTVAVKVTETPTAAGFELEASVIVSGDGAAVMVCVNTVEVLAALLLSPA